VQLLSLAAVVVTVEALDLNFKQRRRMENPKGLSPPLFINAQ
jgi:hypothetical protein